MTIRVLLADDQMLLRSTFRILIDSTADMQVVDEAADGAEAIERAREHRPDVVLMDIRMPGTDGLAATAAICADPDLAETRVLILTTFLGKDVSADDLLDGIRTVAAGEALLSPTATRALITRFLAAPEPGSHAAPERLAALTARETEVMALAAEGLSNDEIAERLFVSPLTARTHVHRAMTKLDARDRAQLVVIAYQCGLVQPSPPAR
jgi:DNA-binding NarL/FixJ family response regulator